MNTNAYVHGTVQFTFFWVMKLKFIIVTSGDRFTLVLVPCFSLLKLKSGLKKYI